MICSSSEKKDGYTHFEEDEVSIVLTANKNAKKPSFLSDADIFSADYPKDSDCLPVKSTSSGLYRNARLGSLTLEEYRENNRRKSENKLLFGCNEVNFRKGHKLSENSYPEIHDAATLKEDKAGPFLENGEIFKTSPMIEEVSNLPVARYRSQFLHAVREHQVLIVIGETGSGKTTQLPKFLYDAGFSTNGLIGCTQPRRAAVTSIASRVSEEMGSELGVCVGYSMRFEEKTSDATRIKYMTDGVLRRECVKASSNYLAKYSVIILDEAHERTLDTDLLLGYMHAVLSVRRDFRLIITSATIQSSLFLNFFPGAHRLRIPGRSHNVEVIHSPVNVTDYVEQAISLAIDIHKKEEMPGDILIFMTGQEDVLCTTHTIRQRLHDYLPKLSESLVILPVYALLSSKEQAEIFRSTPPGKRKCIVATNIAETSLTIDGVKFVIDCGYAKVKVYRPSIGISLLEIYPISKAQANQRSGRAGRTCPGKCFRLYTKEQYQNEMLSSSMPEIQRTNLSSVVLHIKSLGFSDIYDFQFMTPPTKNSIDHACTQLWMLKALDNDGTISSLGKKILDFPTETQLSLFIQMSIETGCSDEAIMIVSLLSVEYRKICDFARSSDDLTRLQTDKFRVLGSDHLTLLNIYQHYRRNPENPDWHDLHKIPLNVMRKVDKIYQQLYDIFSKNSISVTSCGNEFDKVRKALAFSHYLNSARASGISDFIPILFGRFPVKIQASSAVQLSRSADYVIYHEIMGTGTKKEYLSVVTQVDPAWLLHQRPQLFNSFVPTEKEKGGCKLPNENINEIASIDTSQKWDHTLYLTTTKSANVGPAHAKKKNSLRLTYVKKFKEK